MTGTPEAMSTQCILLHIRHLSEHKQILDCFSQEYGRINFVINTKRHPALPTYFRLLQVEFRGQQSLKTLTNFTYQQQHYHIQGRLQVIGLYLNELIYHFTKALDVHPGLLAAYMRCLAHLSLDQHYRLAVRQFELHFLALIGFGIDFQFDTQQQLIQTHHCYLFEALSGFKPIMHAQEKSVTGADIIECAKLVNSKDISELAKTKREYKILSYWLKKQIDTLLAREGKQIQSRQLWVS